MRQRFLLILLVALLPLLAVIVFLPRPAPAASSHLHLNGATLSISQAFVNNSDPSFDSRMCLAHPSPTNCNGVLPFGPHFSVSSQDGGSGSCFTSGNMLIEDQQVMDGGGKVFGDFQLWYLLGCQSYTAHLIADTGTSQTISVVVKQYDGSGVFNGISQLLWHLGDEDGLLPSATQGTGSVQDKEVWSPMLYSPTAPVQASATINSAEQVYGPISNYYAAGKPTTINGKSS